jgi:predicted HicB family RNase H-like nuclease
MDFLTLGPYRGFTGSIHTYDAVQKVFTGSLSRIRDVVTFEGTDWGGLELAFMDSVDDYVADLERDD